DMARAATILNVAIQACANLAIAFEPFLPFMSAKLVRMLGGEKIDWDMLGCFDLVPAGAKIGKAELLFEKVEDETVLFQQEKLRKTVEENRLAAWKPEPVKENVEYDDFAKLDIRVGKVLECINVPKSKKLLQFKIDDGIGGRTILSGIAAYYKPEDLIGKEICFIANFPPRKMMGRESMGMILSAVNADGSLTVIGPQGEVRPGATVG
ncbi:MAG: methionine--tRNA ligase subunit beta, partial [Muribaculaceae bacterium]|nr:methionine--tRNA ligase subunit beta [Muribaculaceae bacterium]